MNGMQSFEEVFRNSKDIECEIFHLEKISTARIKKFNAAMNQYRTYIRKENQLLDRNSNHCEQRNRWYREQIDLSWKNGIANRHLILRSVARTNVLKKDLDDWLERVDQNALRGDEDQSYPSHSHLADEHLEGSQLIDKYNQILREYGHKM